jgi:ribosomal protein S6
MAVLVPEMSDEDTGTAIERVRGYITDVSGEISEVLTDSPWGRRRLAYTIRFNGQDYRDGVYVVTHFNAVPSAISDIERELKLDTSVMRYLLVMDDPKAGEQAGAEGEAPASDEAEAPATESAPAPAATVEAPVAAAAETAADQAAAEPEEVSAPAETGNAPAANSKLPTEGEGTAWVAGDGTNTIPEGFTLKGNASSKIYHPEASGSYNNTIAELYFASPEAAEAAGYRLPKNLQNAGASATSIAESVAQQAVEAAEALPDEENPVPADAATDKED